MTRHERKEQLNPVIAHSEEEAKLLRGVLPAGISVKIKPERITARNPKPLDIVGSGYRLNTQEPPEPIEKIRSMRDAGPNPNLPI